MVQRSLNAQSQEVARISGRSGRNELKAGLLGHLHTIGANVAGRPVDQYRLPSRYLGTFEQRLPRHDVCDWSHAASMKFNVVGFWAIILAEANA
jgi:hypothetical protein